MTSMDHTAASRHLVPIEPKSKSASSVDDARRAERAERERRQSYASQRAGTALAVAVIEGLLKAHRISKYAGDTGKRTNLLPLNPVQQIGLETAIDLLHLHVDTLSHEGGG
ncbi:hypothetical protein [Dyella mobilis]|uniref:DUF2384 domain-containing protein n=1 Tax=Dyella mobilis TaxID=1849582 RepID=A0ABS2KFC4_9GAMM|nr:hypothetical protein [Dyella mobilis]MBM7129580.1 hypothetical protein [Dyella mobilis]GLQ98156.1 hypothetical protein GCM10007863_25760 [Dyella mobilis]